MVVIQDNKPVTHKSGHQAPLAILYQDSDLVAIHKPPNILVHRSPISRDDTFVLQTLRNQLGQWVYPIHRLDRATSGVLLFALNPDTARQVVRQFEARKVEKIYWALTRGWVDDTGCIDHPMADEEGNNQFQPAVTSYRCLARVELPYSVDRYPTSRYSWVEVKPQTGRRQQIRKHFKHISHHLIGDTTHGNGKHNRFFREHYSIQRLMLTAQHLGLNHPVSGQSLVIRANLEPEWDNLLAEFCWGNSVL